MGSNHYSKTILIVDDTPNNLTVLRKILTGQGYRVRPALSGDVALRTIQADIPDLILLDIIMPGMDGFEVCRKLKAEEKTRDVPIIFISALNQIEDKMRAFSEGGVDYISKPFHAEEVLARVKTQITLYSLVNSLGEKNIEFEKAETALRESEKKYRNILENMEDGYFEIDKAGNFTYANAAAARQADTTREKMVGTNFSDYGTETAIKKMFGIFKKMFKTGKPINQAGYSLVTLNGIEKQMEITASVITDIQGRSIGFGGVNRDVTERKTAEEALRQSNEKYRTILDNLDVGYYELDLNGNITGGSDLAGIIVGSSKKDFLGRNFAEYCGEENALALFETYNELYQTGKSIKDIEYQITIPNGDSYTVDASAALMRNAEGKPVGFRGIMRDISERKKAERESLIQEIKLAQLFESSTEAIAFINENDNVEKINSQFTSIFGFPPEEVVGRSLDETIIPKDKVDEGKTIKEKIRKGRDFFHETVRQQKNGNIVDVSVTEIPIYVDNEDAGFYAIYRDISDRKRAEVEIREAGARLQSIIDGVHSVVFVKDTMGRHLLINSFFEEAYAVKKEGIIGKTDLDFFDEDIAKQIMEIDQRIMKSKNPETFEMTIPYADGSVRIHLTEKFPLFDKENKVYGLCGLATDVTHQKEIEKELQQAKKTAEEATNAKSDFLANMSHEIRTPMNAIIGMSHLALQTDLSPKQYDYLDKIKLSSNSLLGIINDILDFSKIEAGKMEMESKDFSLDDVLKNLSSVVTMKSRSKEHLEVLFDIPQNVPRFLKGDSLRLGQVLINLTNNALKFTKSGEIVISVQRLKKDKDRVFLEFAVRDTGIGLSPDQIETLFESFSQADTSTTRKYGGTGLGLTICKSLVEMMGGKIWVNSQIDKGSTFTFTAWFDESAHKKQQIPAPSAQLKDLKVLVVDDSAAARSILENMLVTFGYEVSMASSGEQGLEKLEIASEKNPFDMVLMDLRMPKENGIEISRRIKNHPRLSKIPTIIMVTAYGREDIFKQAEQIGLEGFLSKPVSASELFDAIMLAFGSRSSLSSRVPNIKRDEYKDISDIKGKRILLVEDNEINQEVAKELLEGAGLSVTIAANGQDALEALSASDFMAVLMDIQMPVMDGYQATHKIRKTVQFHDLPIIAMTAHAMAGDREKCLNAGMNDYISKPIDPEKLFGVLTKWIATGKSINQKDLELISPRGSENITDEKFPELPGISVKFGLRNVRGNQKLYKKMLKKFYRNHLSDTEEIKTALKINDQKKAVHLAHSIKGVAGNIGAKGLQKKAGDLEMALEKGRPKNVKDLVNKLTDSMEIVLDSINLLEEGSGDNEKIPNLKKSSLSSVKKSKVFSSLNELKHLIEQDDFAAGNFFEHIQDTCAEVLDRDTLKNLEESLENYDFETALPELSQIIQSFDGKKKGENDA